MVGIVVGVPVYTLIQVFAETYSDMHLNYSKGNGKWLATCDNIHNICDQNQSAHTNQLLLLRDS